MPQIAKYIFNDLAANLFVSLALEQHGGMCVYAKQQRLIVKHFFEVWYQPFFVDAVARKSTANVVVHAA